VKHIDHIVISDGPDDEARAICAHFGVRYASIPENCGNLDAATRDFGAQFANAPYLTYWDDDNYYHKDAAMTIMAAVAREDPDILICQCIYQGGGAGGGKLPRWGVLPPDHWDKKFRFGWVDTMCATVRTEVAKLVSWREHKGVGTDYHWLVNLQREKLDATIAFHQAPIGYHL
jgi:glycosyltransferase involved in cell wall biosynthesis